MNKANVQSQCFEKCCWNEQIRREGKGREQSELLPGAHLLSAHGLPHSTAPERQTLLPPQPKKRRVPLAPKPEEKAASQHLLKGEKEQQEATGTD